MSEGSVTFAITADSSEAFAEIAALQAATDEIARDWVIKRRKIIKEARQVIRLTRSLIGLYRAMMNAMGMSIGAVGESVLMMVQNVLMVASSVMAVATAEAAIGNWAALVVASFALGFSITATFAVATGVENARLESQKAINIMYALEGVLMASGI